MTYTPSVSVHNNQIITKIPISLPKHRNSVRFFTGIFLFLLSLGILLWQFFSYDTQYITIFSTKIFVCYCVLIPSFASAWLLRDAIQNFYEYLKYCFSYGLRKEIGWVIFSAISMIFFYELWSLGENTDKKIAQPIGSSIAFIIFSQIVPYALPKIVDHYIDIAKTYLSSKGRLGKLSKAHIPLLLLILLAIIIVATTALSYLVISARSPVIHPIATKFTISISSPVVIFAQAIISVLVDVTGHFFGIIKESNILPSLSSSMKKGMYKKGMYFLTLFILVLTTIGLYDIVTINSTQRALELGLLAQIPVTVSARILSVLIESEENKKQNKYYSFLSGACIIIWLFLWGELLGLGFGNLDIELILTSQMTLPQLIPLFDALPANRLVNAIRNFIQPCIEYCHIFLNYTIAYVLLDDGKGSLLWDIVLYGGILLVFYGIKETEIGKELTVFPRLLISRFFKLAVSLYFVCIVLYWTVNFIWSSRILLNNWQVSGMLILLQIIVTVELIVFWNTIIAGRNHNNEVVPHTATAVVKEPKDQEFQGEKSGMSITVQRLTQKLVHYYQIAWLKITRQNRTGALFCYVCIIIAILYRHELFGFYENILTSQAIKGEISNQEIARNDDQSRLMETFPEGEYNIDDFDPCNISPAVLQYHTLSSIKDTLMIVNSWDPESKIRVTYKGMLRGCQYTATDGKVTAIFFKNQLPLGIGNQDDLFNYYQKSSSSPIWQRTVWDDHYHFYFPTEKANCLTVKMNSQSWAGMLLIDPYQKNLSWKNRNLCKKDLLPYIYKDA